MQQTTVRTPSVPWRQSTKTIENFTALIDNNKPLFYVYDGHHVYLVSDAYHIYVCVHVIWHTILQVRANVSYPIPGIVYDQLGKALIPHWGKSIKKTLTRVGALLYRCCSAAACSCYWCIQCLWCCQLLVFLHLSTDLLVAIEPWMTSSYVSSMANKSDSPMENNQPTGSEHM